MHIVSFAVGFVAAAALAAWKPNTFRRVVDGVVIAYTWARKKFIGDPSTDTDESE